MRRFMLAALVAVALMFAPEGNGGARAAVGDTGAVSIPVPHDRSAVINGPDGKVHDLGPHNDNPFPSKADCVAGLEGDTKTIFLMLAQGGLDITKYDVVVTCKPTELQGS